MCRIIIYIYIYNYKIYDILLCFFLVWMHVFFSWEVGVHCLEAEWNRESQWVSALAAGGARGEFEAHGRVHSGSGSWVEGWGSVCVSKFGEFFSPVWNACHVRIFQAGILKQLPHLSVNPKGTRQSWWCLPSTSPLAILRAPSPLDLDASVWKTWKRNSHGKTYMNEKEEKTTSTLWCANSETEKQVIYSYMLLWRLGNSGMLADFTQEYLPGLPKALFIFLSLLFGMSCYEMLWAYIGLLYLYGRG